MALGYMDLDKTLFHSDTVSGTLEKNGTEYRLRTSISKNNAIIINALSTAPMYTYTGAGGTYFFTFPTKSSLDSVSVDYVYIDPADIVADS